MHLSTANLVHKHTSVVCSANPGHRPSVHTHAATVEAKPMSKGRASQMQGIFPEALQSLQEADPEVHGIIQDEKKRQWCAL